jgi:histo-blood group ABO system transferase
MIKKISINLIATNKYVYFLDAVIKSIDNFFFKNSNILIIVHTNMNINQLGGYSERVDILKNEIEHEPWPFTTLKRFSYFIKAKEAIAESDYSFYIDVDSLFIGEIFEDFLPPFGIIGTIHPCLYQGNGTPERNPRSKAFISFNENNRYFCGGFFGGDSKSFLNMAESINLNIEEDLRNGIIAVWHDESHINRFLLDNPPSLILEPPFAIAESLAKTESSSKILFLDKSLKGGHDFFRN